MRSMISHSSHDADSRLTVIPGMQLALAAYDRQATNPLVHLIPLVSVLMSTLAVLDDLPDYPFSNVKV